MMSRADGKPEWPPGIVPDCTAAISASRFRSSIPTSSDSCWHANALTSASNTVGNRGGFRPRNRSAITPSRRSCADIRYQSARLTPVPSSRSIAERRRRRSAAVHGDGVVVTTSRGASGEPSWRTLSAVVRPPTAITRRYVPPSHRSMALRARRRSAHTVRSRRKGGTGRTIR